MPIPTLDKTWQHDVNNRVLGNSSGQTDNEDFTDGLRTLFYEIKEALKGFGLAPWTVVGSSDFVASNMTGTDLITDPITDLRSSQKGLSQAHSWIVLEQTGLGASGLQVLFNHECANSGDGALMDVYISQTGFGSANGGTDGSITARPTATDELLILDGNVFGLGGSWGAGSASPTAIDWVFHAMQSTDGACTRVFIYNNNQPFGVWLFDTIKDPVTGFTSQLACAILQDGDSNTLFTPSHTLLNINANVKTIQSGSLQNLYLTGEGFANDLIPQHQLLQRPNQLNAELPLPSIGVASLDVGFVGRHGRLFDIWWGPEHDNNLQNRDGRTYPATASPHQFVQFGHLILPWDGATVPQVI